MIAAALFTKKANYSTVTLWPNFPACPRLAH
jgi:hypothetical protein